MPEYAVPESYSRNARERECVCGGGALIASLEQDGEGVVVPTPALSEALVTLAEKAIEQTEQLERRICFRIKPFGKREAIEIAMRTRAAMIAGDKREGVMEPWQKDKHDRQIVAIAKTENVTAFGQGDSRARQTMGNPSSASRGFSLPSSIPRKVPDRGDMKPVTQRPINITPDIAAKCDAPNQFERFDHMYRTVIAKPKAEIDKRDTKWKRARARKRPPRKKSRGKQSRGNLVTNILSILLFLVLMVSPVFADLGEVTMRHDANGNWAVYKADGSLLNTAGSPTQGWNEGIAYAWSTGSPPYCFVVDGGGVANFSSGAFHGAVLTTATTLVFPPGFGNCFHSHGVLYQWTGSDANTSIFVTMDSVDFTEIDFHTSLFVYPSSGKLIYFNPIHDNGEGLGNGATSSHVSFGSLVCTLGYPPFLPDSTRGTALDISPNGYFYSMIVDIKEINGCATGVLVENPSIQFGRNKFTGGDIHGQGTVSIKIGTSALSNTVFSNRWDLNLTPASTGNCLETWGGSAFGGYSQRGGDRFDVNCTNGVTGVTVQSSAANNKFTTPTMSVSGVDFVNNAISQTNVIDDTSPLRALSKDMTQCPSPCVHQNVRMKTEQVIIDYGGISRIDTAAVNTDAYYMNTGQIAGQFTLKPGQFLRLTYSGNPALISFNEIW